MFKKKPTLLVQIGHTIIVIVAGAIGGVIFQELFTKHVLPFASFVLVVILIFLIIMSLMVWRTFQLTEELRNNVGVKIMYVDRDRYGRANVFAEARKIVEKAEHSIFVLNSFLGETPEDTDDRADAPEAIKRQRRKVIQERDKYYETMLERALDGVIYERILQVREGQKLATVAKDEGYRRHFYRILEEKEKNPKLQLGLLKAPAKRLSTFVLVDDENLIWQINEVLPSGDIQMQGVFIIQDPRREITQHFKTFIQNARRDSFGAVQYHELPPLQDQ
jgi:hypothetical protein